MPEIEDVRNRLPEILRQLNKKRLLTLPHFLAESSHNLAFWRIKADGAGHNGLEGIGVAV
jgi:predicted NAD-dependent protein-ADP-ribosyltransferase YbiA (DUF1768 family)